MLKDLEVIKIKDDALYVKNLDILEKIALNFNHIKLSQKEAHLLLVIVIVGDVIEEVFQ